MSIIESWKMIWPQQNELIELKNGDKKNVRLIVEKCSKILSENSLTELVKKF
jgi:hypothetical protein